MKRKNFLMLAFVAVAFVTCSNEDLASIGNPGDDNQLMTDPIGDAWMALTVEIPVQTYGLYNLNQEAATEDESKITAVRTMFFTVNTSEDAATVTADLTLDSDEVGFDVDGIPSEAVGKVFKVPATPKRILIITNPSPKFEAKTASEADQKWPVGTTYTTVNATLDDIPASMTTAGKFTMPNAKGSSEPSDEDETSGTFGASADLALYVTETAATNNPISIRIGRVVSKVRVYITAGFNAKTTISNAGWVSDAINRTFFFVPKRTLTWNEIPANEPLGARGTCITPFDQCKIGSYRVNPNYGTQALASCNAYASTSAPSTWNDPITTANKVTEYCLENMQTVIHNVHTYIIHVLLKAKFIPSEYDRPAPNDGTPPIAQEIDPKLAGDWVLINGGFYTSATLMEWIEAELRVEYAGKELTIFPIARTTVHDGYLAAVGVGEVSLPATADATAITSLIDDLKVTKVNVRNAAVKDGAITVTGLAYYVGAVSYYKIMIKRDDTSAITNELGEFGVVCSSIYGINARKFNNPGYPAIPDPGGGASDESDEG